MKTKLIKPLVMKSGKSFPIDTPAWVIPTDNDLRALVGIGDIEFKMRTSMLNYYFEGFILFTMDDLETAMMDGECPSITGQYSIEMDGHDCDGWPSIMMAAGMI